VSIELEQPADGQQLTVHLTGKLRKEDYVAFLPAVEEAIRNHGKLRMLVDMHDFHGWSAGGLWEDIKFDARHFNDIDRLAIVGEKKWEEWMATFCKPFTTAKVKYFPREQMAEARAWLAAERPATS
jgi:hypothetical protein